MGMFDEVVCRYRLPHHQEARFQTKDLAAVALGERCLGGLLDEYLITEDGRLRRHVHEREWVEDAGAPFRGYLRSVRDWWEDVPGAHGDVVVYTTEPAIASPRAKSAKSPATTPVMKPSSDPSSPAELGRSLAAMPPSPTMTMLCSMSAPWWGCE